MRRKLTVALVCAGMAVGAVVVAMMLTIVSPDQPASYALCKERMAADFRAGTEVTTRPRECEGLTSEQLEQIVGEILTEELSNG